MVMANRVPKTLIFADCDNGGIVHVANIKGGVGKSTVATNLAAAFSRKGPTLLIDLDVQGSATVAVGKDPAAVRNSSWQLFSRRFSAEHFPSDTRDASISSRAAGFLGRAESRLFSQVVGHGEVTAIAVTILPCLDLLPANADLFKPIFFFQLQNFLYNLELCRTYYKYIVLDTPSVWNSLTKSLYIRSTLNLIPVTLNALATKSLKDYFHNVKIMARKNPAVRVRIIKNEVFGREDSKIKGKTRTMNENRRYLDGLCEQVQVKTGVGFSTIPQSVMFDLEIPESAVIRDAQDEGKTVHEFHQYSAATRAFEELAKRVQYVLNTPPARRGKSLFRRLVGVPRAIPRFVAGCLSFVVLGINLPVTNAPPPRPVAPQQLVEPSQPLFSHTFVPGESLDKYAKYAICLYRAIVPGPEEIEQYAKEEVNVYNRTRLPGEPKLPFADEALPGATIVFYPPADIVNPKEKQLVPVYKYFMAMVDDPYSYVTGDWCDRGMGGGTPHYGIDVAAKLGSNIITPIEGIVVNRESVSAGHTLGVVRDGMILTFSHMDKRFFQTGQIVKKGMAVGTIGLTGKTTGPHVHIGYGVRTVGTDGIAYGRSYYKFTDPKLFFYREQYLADASN